MKPSPQTLILVALSTGMLVSAYLIGPAPASTSGAPTAPLKSVATASAPAPAKPASTIKAARAPVPLAVNGHSEFVTASADPTKGPMLDITGKGTALGAAPSETGPAPEQAAAQAAIEQDGYRKVRSLVKAPDGTWRGRAMRGSTEVAVRVDATGSVGVD